MNSGLSESESSLVHPDLTNKFTSCDLQEPVTLQDSEETSTEIHTENVASGSDIVRNSACFLLELREAKGLSQVAVDTVVEKCGELISEFLHNVHTIIKSKIQDSEQLRIIEDSFQHCKRPFDGLQNKYQQEKFYVQELNMIEPVMKELGRTVYKLSGSGSKRRRIATSESFYYYIPILSTLKQFLSREDVFNHINTCRSTSVALLHDFRDGQEFCEHPLFSSDPTAIQIIAYYDDIEVCNPLGSSSKKHKLGLFLFTIGNIHPKFRSSLKCMFLFAVAKTDDIHKYTPDVILSPFVSDINALASTGITITCSTGCTQTFKGSLLAFLADNLASYTIGGFKESFSFAYRFCRSCLATHAEASIHFLSHDFSQRTPLNHKHHCDLLKGPLGSHHSITYGINRWSILGDIPNFSVVNNLPHDIMHDLLDGIMHDELTLLLKHCLLCKYFRLNSLNELILSFDYGYSESSNKPATIESVSAFVVKLRQSASQMWLLSRSLPLLIGHFVPDDDKPWRCYWLLLTILDICTSHTSSANTVPYLITLIKEHHTLFKEVYPHASITPKMHFLVHYPEQILLFGPVIYSCTMRYESKLKLCKQAVKFGNFKNICFSVAQKHQRWLCYQMQASQYLTKVPEVGGQSTVLSLKEEPVSIKHLLGSMDISDLSPVVDKVF